MSASRLPPLALLALAACWLSCVASPAFAQNATEQVQAQVGVVTPLSFIQTEELNFGKIFASNTAGTVTVAPNGTRTRTGC